jgi:hypothetical protein
MHSCRVGLISVAQQFEADTEQAAGKAGVLATWIAENVDLGIMPLCDFTHNRKTQTATFSVAAKNSIEAIKY